MSGHNSFPAPLVGIPYWRYEEPAAANKAKKQLLLTIGGTAVIGVWQGSLGQYFLAYSPLPDRNKEIENGIKQVR